MAAAPVTHGRVNKNDAQDVSEDDGEWCGGTDKDQYTLPKIQTEIQIQEHTALCVR